VSGCWAGYERNLGNLCPRCASLGWLAGAAECRDHRSSYALTDEGERVVTLMRGAWGSIAQLVDSLPRAEHYFRLFRDKSAHGDVAAAEYRSLLALAKNEWAWPRSRDRGPPRGAHLRGYLDGVLLSTTMVALGSPLRELERAIGVIAPPVFASLRATKGEGGRAHRVLQQAFVPCGA